MSAEVWLRFNLVSSRLALTVRDFESCVELTVWTSVRSLDELGEKARMLVVRAIDRLRERNASRKTIELLEKWLR